MTVVRSILSVLLVYGLLAGAASAQQQSDNAPAAATTPSTADTTIQRRVSLAELGFRQGIEFSGLNGSQELFFPVPATGLQSVVLHLKMHSQSAFKSRRSIQIRVAGKIVATRALGQDANTEMEVPVDPAALQGRFLKVSLVYSGAVTEDRCLDQRVSGDFVSIDPSSSLDMRLSPSAFDDVRSVLALMPRDVTILTPAQASSESETEAILRVSSMLRAQDARVSYETFSRDGLATGSPVGEWSEGRIVVATDLSLNGEARPSADSGISVVNLEDGPAILLDGSDPGSGARFLASRWRAFASSPSVSIKAAAERTSHDGELTFADLGADVSSRSLVDRAVFETGFRATDLPAGTEPRRLDLDLAIAKDFAGTNATIAAFMNGSLLASTTSPGAVPATLTASIPSGLFHQENSIRVVVQRQPQTGDCANPPQGFPVQLLPSSALRLGPSGETPRDFFGLSSVFAGGVTVFLPEEEGRSGILPGLSSIVANLVPPGASIDIRSGMPDAAFEKPFILVSSSLPSALEAPVRFDGGRVVLTGPESKPILDVDGLDRQGLAELVRTDAASGLWIHPGDDGLAASERPMNLDRGNVALLADGEVSFSFSTERDRLVEVRYPDRRSYLDLARQYRPWLIGAGWLLLTILFVLALSRLYRRRSD